MTNYCTRVGGFSQWKWMDMPAVCQVGLGLFFAQRESDSQRLLTQQREVRWGLHGQSCRKTAHVLSLHVQTSDQPHSNGRFPPATVSSTLASTFSSPSTDSSTVPTSGSFNLARASNSYNNRSVSVGSSGKLPVCKCKQVSSCLLILNHPVCMIALTVCRLVPDALRVFQIAEQI